MTDDVVGKLPVEVDGEAHTVSVFADEAMDPEALIQSAIDRVRALNDELPCRENLQIIQHLSQALAWQEARSAERDTQHVKGSDLPHEGPHEWYCTVCGARVDFHVHGA